MPDYIFMLESRLLPGQLKILNFLQEEAQDSQLNLYLVGGAVRDLMTGSTIRDLDFVFEGNPLKLVKRFRDAAPKRVRINDAMKSAELVLENGVRLSLEMARSETYQRPGGVPDIRPSTIIDDLRRRDFTINAMAISLTPGSRGLMLDPTNGLADVENRELRTLHNYSFLHDPSRMMRLVRYTARLGFSTEERTKEQFDSALYRGYLEHLTKVHLQREFYQMAWEPNVVPALKALQAQGMLAPYGKTFQRRGPDFDGLGKYHRQRERAEEHGYWFDPANAVIHYMVRRLSGGDAAKVFRNAGLEATAARALKKWLGEAKSLVTAMGRIRGSQPVKVYRLLEKVPSELLVFVLVEYANKKNVKSKVETHLYKQRPMRNTLPVAALESLGVARGPKFDKLLEQYFERQLEGRLRSGTDVLKVLRKLAGIPEPKPEVVVEEPPPEKEATPKVSRKAEAKAARRSKVRKQLLKQVASKKAAKGQAPGKAAAGKKAKGKAPGKEAAGKKAKGKAAAGSPGAARKKSVKKAPKKATRKIPAKSAKAGKKRTTRDKGKAGKKRR